MWWYQATKTTELITDWIYMNVRKDYIFRILEANNLETVHARLFIVTRNFGIYKLTIAIRCISNILWNIGNIPTKPNRTFFMKLAATQETSIYVWFLNKSDTQHLFSLTQIYSIWSRKSWSSLWIKVEHIISASFSEFFSFMTLTNFLTIFIVLISCWMSFVPVWITRTFGFFRMAVFT